MNPDQQNLAASEDMSRWKMMKISLFSLFHYYFLKAPSPAPTALRQKTHTDSRRLSSGLGLCVAGEQEAGTFL